MCLSVLEMGSTASHHHNSSSGSVRPQSAAGGLWKRRGYQLFAGKTPIHDIKTSVRLAKRPDKFASALVSWLTSRTLAIGGTK